MALARRLLTSWAIMASLEISDAAKVREVLNYVVSKNISTVYLYNN